MTDLKEQLTQIIKEEYVAVFGHEPKLTRVFNNNDEAKESDPQSFHINIELNPLINELQKYGLEHSSYTPLIPFASQFTRRPDEKFGNEEASVEMGIAKASCATLNTDFTGADKIENLRESLRNVFGKLKEIETEYSQNPACPLIDATLMALYAKMDLFATYSKNTGEAPKISFTKEIPAFLGPAFIEGIIGCIPKEGNLVAIGDLKEELQTTLSNSKGGFKSEKLTFNMSIEAAKLLATADPEKIKQLSAGQSLG